MGATERPRAPGANAGVSRPVFLQPSLETLCGNEMVKAPQAGTTVRDQCFVQIPHDSVERKCDRALVKVACVGFHEN